MSLLKVYETKDPHSAWVYDEDNAVAEELAKVGILLEQWTADQSLSDTATQDDILAAYRGPVDRLMTQYGFQSVDVISLTPAHPDKEALRAKFLDEHTHSDYEVRFFVEGKGLFYIHLGDQVYAVLCEKGDLISVPANTPHWFDMGPNPSFKCIRLFSSPEGWVAHFTGSDIAKQFPRLNN